MFKFTYYTLNTECRQIVYMENYPLIWSFYNTAIFHFSREEKKRKKREKMPFVQITSNKIVFRHIFSTLFSSLLAIISCTQHMMILTYKIMTTIDAVARRVCEKKQHICKQNITNRTRCAALCKL